jgi:hypothetical protein
MRSSKKLYLFTSWIHAFNQTINIIWLTASLAHFRYKDITVNITVNVGIAFHAYQTMLFCVIKSVSCAARDNEPVELIGFNPDQLFYSLITPFGETFSSEFHCTTRYPQEDDPFIL